MWSMRLKSAIPAIALGSGMASAAAADFSIASLPVTRTGYSNVLAAAAGGFPGLYSFEIPVGAMTIDADAPDRDLSLVDGTQSTPASGAAGDSSGTAVGPYAVVAAARTAPVPEPRTSMLLLAGLAAGCLIVRRRRSV